MKRPVLLVMVIGIGFAMCAAEVMARGGGHGGGGHGGGGGSRGGWGGGGWSRGGGWGGGYSNGGRYSPGSTTMRRSTPTARTPVSNRTPVTSNRTPVTINRTPVTTNRTPLTINRAPVASNRTPVTSNRTPSGGTNQANLTGPGRQFGVQTALFTNRGNNGLGNIRVSASRAASRYALTNGLRNRFGFSYHGRHHHHWTHRCWSSHHGCWTYWDPGCRCYYYWCSPDECFYPCSYCPHSTYCWNSDSYCVTSCPEVDCQTDDPTTVPVTTDAGETPVADSGMRIEELLNGTARDQGMKVGDIIVSLNGQATPDFDALRAALEASGPQADVDFINVDNGQLERIVLQPEDTRIGATVDQVEVQ